MSTWLVEPHAERTRETSRGRRSGTSATAPVSGWKPAARIRSRYQPERVLGFLLWIGLMFVLLRFVIQ